jgi:hypothetical protein
MQRKAWVSFVLLGLGAVVLGGCPIYPESQDHRVCLQSGQCFSCPNDYYSSDCYAYACGSDYDCPGGYVCSSYNTCVSGGGYPVDATAPGNSCGRPSDCAPGYNCGADDQCHPGDCSNTGCPSGYQCKLSNGTLQCVANGFIPDGGGGDGPIFTGCRNDKDCSAVPGAKCLDGKCVAPPGAHDEQMIDLPRPVLAHRKGQRSDTLQMVEVMIGNCDAMLRPAVEVAQLGAEDRRLQSIKP